MTTPTPKPRWYHLTPDRFFIGLLVVQVFLFLSERFQWFAFNERKGWTVLIAVGVVGLAVLVMLLWGLVCLCLRRRFQFSFRSLLVFLVAVSVPLGWFAWEMRRARRQKEAVEAVTEAGGVVSYDYVFVWAESGKWLDEGEAVAVTMEAGGAAYFDCPAYDNGGWSVPRLREPTTPPWLLNLVGEDFFHEVGEVRLFPSTSSLIHGLDDDGMKHLKTLTSLRTLHLLGQPITDDGLEHLKPLTNLEHLYVGGPDTTDEGLKSLRQSLPNCTIVY